MNTPNTSTCIWLLRISYTKEQRYGSILFDRVNLTRFTFTRHCIHHLFFLHYIGIETLPFRSIVFPSVENMQLPKTSNVTPTHLH
jgi:hypothetical protein